ncbi:MAG: iron-containing alcohol dehydrogenase [Bacteroidales bacterium]|nr:iron-containing alcohol dehydrogenase [Bacteroidales bacterium]
MNEFQFARIPKIHFGPGSISLLPGILSHFGTRILIVASKTYTKTTSFPLLLNELRKQALHPEAVDLSGEPSPLFVDTVVQQTGPSPPDVVVSIGGGSIVDAGKAISAMIPQEGSVRDFLEGVGIRKHTGQKIPFIAIPTTAGTGSEATKNAVLSETGPEGFKKSLRHDNFVPDITIVDPELTRSCPADISMPVGMDAFTQLLEAFTSTHASPMTDALAYSGMARVVESLPQVFKEPDNLEARTDMAFGALMSGITLANAGLGIVHGFASAIGGMFPIPHGVVCGALLAPATRINIAKLKQSEANPVSLRKYVETGKLFSDEQKSDDYFLKVLVEKLFEWTTTFNIPKLRMYGVTDGDFDRIISGTTLKNNPVELSRDELMQILTLAS